MKFLTIPKLQTTERRILEKIKRVSSRKPERTRQEVIQLKSPISLKLGTNAWFGERMILAEK